MALTPEQREAARLVGHGSSYEEVSTALGGNPVAATIGRWAREVEEFQEAVEEARREDLLAEPEAVAALRRALHAKKKDGTDDHSVQVQAARALLSRRGVGSAVKQPARVRETRIYVQPEGDDDGDAG